MRGWKVGEEEDYPLKSEVCNTASLEMDKIERNINLHHSELTNFVEGLDDSEKDVLKSLPLIKLNAQKNLYISNNEQEGLTIYKRLEIIFGDTGNVYACIRMSSNYLISSANYYYRQLTGNDLIDVTHLDLIS